MLLWLCPSHISRETDTSEVNLIFFCRFKLSFINVTVKMYILNKQDNCTENFQLIIVIAHSSINSKIELSFSVDPSIVSDLRVFVLLEL